MTQRTIVMLIAHQQPVDINIENVEHCEQADAAGIVPPVRTQVRAVPMNYSITRKYNTCKTLRHFVLDSISEHLYDFFIV